MSDVDCPYCGFPQEICHDDGYGYEEDVVHEQECIDCEKTFVFETFVSYFYDAKKADCLNGGFHRYKPTNTVPRKYTRMRCRDCDRTRPLTDAEREELLGEDAPSQE